MEKKKTGFTLIEMVIVLALTVIVLVIASSMLGTGNKVFSDSDVKTALQIEGQAIQENISDIGMQAQKIMSSEINNGEVRNLIIKSYDKDDNIKYFKIEVNGEKLSISKCKNPDGSGVETSEEISQNIKEFKILYTGNLYETNSVEFNVKLSAKKALTDAVDYPIDFKVVFRNNGVKA